MKTPQYTIKQEEAVGSHLRHTEKSAKHLAKKLISGTLGGKVTVIDPKGKLIATYTS